MRKISVIHPSRARAEQSKNTILNWLGNADCYTPFQYILSLDNSDNTDYGLGKGGIMNLGVAVTRNDNKTAIEAINNAAKMAIGDIIIVVSDDTDCPEHWDTLLLKALEGKSDFCVKTDDGLQPTLITMPIMDRIYYERYGYIYHPDYLHLHADEELTCVALMTGKYIKIPLLFPHNHYTTGHTEKDEINIKNDSTWGQGQRTLDRHALNNFGIENPVIQRKDIVWR